MRGYTLPSGKVQISFSGGRTSAYMLHQILAVNGDFDPARVQVIFANTGREMPGTLDFVQECGERFGVKIVWVEDAARVKGEPLFDIVSHNSASRKGEPFKRLIERKKACPDQSKRFCTEHLKILPARRYLMSLGWKEWANATGIRADEPDRLKPSPDKRVKKWYPLEDVTVDTVMKFWAAMPFDLRVEKGLGNCDGCFMKSEAQLAALCRDHPERHQWWEDIEALASGLTKNPNGARFREQFSRSELRDTVERQGDFLFSTEDGFCHRSLGECT
jgi:Phosphoadenosine phosphosulfate reductase family